LNDLSTTFDVLPLPLVAVPTVEFPVSSISEDADVARDNLKNLIDTATEALNGMLNVATQTEDPKAYTVVADLIRVAAELNARVMDTHAVAARVNNMVTSAVTSATQHNRTTNNIVFSGTSAELALLLKE